MNPPDLSPPAGDFWASFTPDDFTTPRVTIGMGSPIKGKLGHFNFSTGESFAELTGVTFLGRTNGQILYGGMGQVPARCASDDGLNPSPRIAQPITSPNQGGCRVCFAKEWGQDPRKDALQGSLGLNAAAERPACQTTVSLLLADQTGMPFVLMVKTHNVAIIKKQLFTNLRMRSIAHKAPGYGIGFDLTLLAMPGLGNRYQIVVSNWKVLGPEDIELRANLWEIFGKRTAEIVGTQHAALDQTNKPGPAAYTEEVFPFDEHPRE